MVIFGSMGRKIVVILLNVKIEADNRWDDDDDEQHVARLYRQIRAIFIFMRTRDWLLRFCFRQASFNLRDHMYTYNNITGMHSSLS